MSDNVVPNSPRCTGKAIARDSCDQPYWCRDFDVEHCNGYRL